MRFYGPFLFPFSIPFFYATLGPFGPLLTPIALAVLLLGAERLARRGAAEPAPEMRAARWMPYAYVVVQCALIAWATWMASRPATPISGFASLAFAVGLTTGVFGVLAAHDLVHGRARLGHAFGAAMLTAMSYRHFRIAHIFGHHRYACTARDSATARLGEPFYAFLRRTLPGQWCEAYAFERQRCVRKPSALLMNRVQQDAAIMAVLLIGLGLVWGVRAPLFFLTQSAVAIFVLELFNYIAHYGLTREHDGATERMAAHHSWNSSNLTANLFLFNMGRHVDHHARPAAAFDTLTYAPEAPELPVGYAGAILTALVPPLWRRVMDKRVLAARALRNA